MTTSKKKLPEVNVGMRARVIRNTNNDFHIGDIVVCTETRPEWRTTSNWTNENTTNAGINLWDWRACEGFKEIEPLEKPEETDEYYFVPVGEKFQPGDLLLNKYANTWKTTNCHLCPKLKVWDYGIVKRKKGTEVNNTNTREVVVFTLHCGFGQKGIMSGVLAQAFDISAATSRELADSAGLASTSYPNNEVYRPEITCTLEQFARFMILRNNAGLNNSFKCLKPTIVKLKEEEKPKQIKIDVTGNTDRVEI